MRTALILSGGEGTRFGGQIPKQYYEVKNKPIIGYCLDSMQQSNSIDQIVIVLSDLWKEFVSAYITKNNISKMLAFAPSGKSRQHSILNGLEIIREHKANQDDIVVIHDAARPLVSQETIDKCVEFLEEFDMSMPIISIKDTVYYSEKGIKVDSLLDRDKLFAGQSPEGCRFGSYYRICSSLSDQELASVRGTSAIGFQYGLSVGLFAGDERNFKITTQNDLIRFRMIVGDKG